MRGWQGSSEVFGSAFRNLVRQLPEALKAAVARSQVCGSAEGGLTLHIWITCNQGRHRSVALARCIRQFIKEQVTPHVAMVFHHLRAGPHDDRGPCGCATQDCALYRRTPELNEKAAQRREEVEAAATSVFEVSGGSFFRRAVRDALSSAGLTRSQPAAGPSHLGHYYSAYGAGDGGAAGSAAQPEPSPKAHPELPSKAKPLGPRPASPSGQPTVLGPTPASPSGQPTPKKGDDDVPI